MAEVTQDLPSLLTVREVAAASRRSEKAIRHRAASGQEPAARRVGGRLLFPLQSVLDWLGETPSATATAAPIAESVPPTASRGADRKGKRST